MSDLYSFAIAFSTGFQQRAVQSWESYFIEVIYYILLFTFANSNALQLHITWI